MQKGKRGLKEKRKEKRTYQELRPLALPNANLFLSTSITNSKSLFVALQI